MVTESAHRRAIPGVADHVRRPAPFARLVDCQRRFALTWVVGLPGSGKTSLVAAWVAESEVPCFWYRLDESDRDAAALFGALGEAFGGQRRLPVWSPEHQAELDEFARRLFAELAHEPLTLVLDDCHRVADDSDLLVALAAVREVAGAMLRVIVVSRRAPPPSLLRGVVGGWLGLVDDLRLGAAEAHAIASAVRGGELDAEARAGLARADGWLARVLAVAHHGGSALIGPGAWETSIGDFLATELLASLPREHRAGLRRLAELPEIPQTVPEARLLTPEVARLLTTLTRQGYFVDSLGGVRWRIHDLLRDALQGYNVREDGPELRRAVRRDLAAWVAASMPETAMQLRVSAEDTTGALELLATHGERWLASGLHQTVDSWLRDLPVPADPHQRTALALWRAQALLPREPEAARPRFAEARRAAVAVADAGRAYAAWCGEVASYVVQWGAVQGLADLVDDLEALEASLGPPSGELAFRTGADALTALMYGRPEDPRILRYAEATARAVVHAPEVGARISAAAQLLIYRLWWTGDFAGGRALYDSFAAEVDEGDQLAALPRLLWWSCAAIVDWQCGLPARCYAKVDRGLALAAASGIHVRDFFLLTQGIFCALSQEDWARAEGYLKQLARIERTHKRLDVMVHHFFRSWHSLCRGDAATALAHAETAWPIAEAIGSMFHKVIVLSALAPARVHCGDLEGAERAYREQLTLAKAAHNPTFSFIAFCAGAEIAMARGDQAGLAKQVERMLRVKQLGGFHSGCGWRTPMMRSVLAFALQHDIWPETARAWIREKRITPPTPAPPGWPMPVQLRACDGLVVQLDGQAAAGPRGAARKGARKLYELLAILVAERHGAMHDDLLDWLWPEAEGDRASASLKVAIHRVRQWLGSDSVVVHNGRVGLDPAHVECDIWRGGAGAAPPALDPARVLHGFDLPPVLALRKKLAAQASATGR